MEPSPVAENGGPAKPQDNWNHTDDHAMGPRGDADPANGLPPSAENPRGSGNNPDYPRGSSVDVSVSGSKADTAYRDKQVKPNKVYVGGLPEHTRVEDLQSCFGKIGNIVNIELKLGYGFVEFDSREAAEESVAKYHEGYFMGNKIRVELSRGGGKTAKYGDPGACFKCGQMGHWARECPTHPGGTYRRPHHGSHDAPLIDRIQAPSRHYPPNPPPRDYGSYRDEPSSGRYPPPRDPRFDYPPQPAPARELRRPVTPPPEYREYRDYPQAPPSTRSGRDYDRDYRTRGPPPTRFEQPNYYPPDSDAPGYPPRGYGSAPPAPPRDAYDRYERRPPPPPPPPPPSDRYGTYPPASARPRSPAAAPPPRARDDYERSHRRDYPPAEYRGRPASPVPPRYNNDYPPRAPSPEIQSHRYRRRSASPPPRASGSAHYDSGYQGSGSGGGFASSGYSGGVSGGPPPSHQPSHQPSRSGGNSREYARNGRDDSVSYRRQ